MEISEAYGKYYDVFKKSIDKDGWFDGINLPTGAMGLIAQMTSEIPCDLNKDNFKLRPKSLNKPYIDPDFEMKLSPNKNDIMDACMEQIKDKRFGVGKCYDSDFNEIE